jgi:hypothetical protein
MMAPPPGGSFSLKHHPAIETPAIIRVTATVRTIIVEARMAVLPIFIHCRLDGLCFQHCDARYRSSVQRDLTDEREEVAFEAGELHHEPAPLAASGN